MRGDYVHVDVSDQFSTFGFYSTVLWSVLSGILIFRSCSQPLISLACSLCMVLWRHMLTDQQHGPIFYVNGCLFIEPLIFLLGSLQLQAILKENTQHSLRNTPGSTTSSAFSLIMGYDDEIWRQRIYSSRTPPLIAAMGLSATALASTLTMTGSLSTVVLVTLTYDEISWTDYIRDMVLPCVCGWVLLVVSGLLLVARGGTSVEPSGVLPQNDTSYDKVATEVVADDNGQQVHEDSEFSDSQPSVEEDDVVESTGPQPLPEDDTFKAFVWEKVVSVLTFFARFDKPFAGIAMVAAFALGSSIYFVPPFVGTMFILVHQTT